jgi:hypothetical protein
MAAAQHSVVACSTTGLNRSETPLRLLENESNPGARRRLSGRAVVPAIDCSYSQQVTSEDLIAVDFDADSVDRDGLYLVEFLGTDRVDWMGCRRFARSPAGLMVDLTGEGEWTRLPGAMHDNGIRIVGRVERVYRPQ